MNITGPKFKEDTRLHLFSRELAAQNHGGSKNRAFDIDGAILLTDLARNIVSIKKYREAHKEAYRKAEGWYSISVKELAKRHPYFKERTVRRILARLRKVGVLRTTKELHKRKSIHTLWYSFADNEVFKDALAKEDAISFWLQDAVEVGVEAAILLRNLVWVEEHGLSKDDWISINPVEFLEATNLPMSVQAVRRALSVLVDRGRLERERKARYGDSCYLYRLVDTPHLQHYEERDPLPTECFESQDEDNLPSEYYDDLPPQTAHRHQKDKEDRLLTDFAGHVAKVKGQSKTTPNARKTTTSPKTHQSGQT